MIAWIGWTVIACCGVFVVGLVVGKSAERIGWAARSKQLTATFEKLDDLRKRAELEERSARALNEDTHRLMRSMLARSTSKTTPEA